MRKALLFALFFISAVSFSQAPQYINYQAIARDASGNIVTTGIGIKFEILQGSSVGTLVYEETNNITPSSVGIFTTAIGSGSPVSGTFSAINWANSPYFLRVSIDPTGGTSYSTVGTSQLLSVPYALYAEKAGNTQTVNISGSGVLGSYPNYTINAPGALTPSTGISIVGGTVTNTAPDQTVTLTQAGISSVTGTYPSYTIDVPAPSLNYNTGTNVLTLTQGTAVATTTLVGAGSNTVAMTAQGIATVTPVGAGSSFTVGVPPPTFTNVGATTITGSYPNFTVNSPGASTLTPTNLQINSPHSTTTLSSNNYSINIVPTSITGSGVSGAYPNYTITPAPATTVIAGTNVTIGGTGPSYTVNAVPTLSIGSGSISISGGNSVALPAAPPQTTVSAGNNIGVAGTAPTFTVSTPTYSLNFSNSSTGILTNGINNSPVSLPQPTLTLSGANNNVISAGSNSITIPTYTAGNGLTISGTSPNFTIGAVSTGTSAPWSTLGNTGTNPGVNFLGTTDAQDLVFRTANTQRMRLYNATGNVGIGNITTASELLQVETGSNTAMSILSGTNSTLFFGNAGNHQRGRITYDNTTDLMNFGTNLTASFMTINSAGKVGIGTTGPAELLQLQSSSNTDLSLISPGGSLASLAFGFTGNHFMGRIQYDITNNTMNFWTNNTPDRIFIDGSGKIGMGTNSPISDLDVNGSLRLNGNRLFFGNMGGINSGYTGIYGTATGDLKFAVFQTGAVANPPFASGGNSIDAMTIKNTNGFVGMGTTSPQNRLDVNGAAVIGSGYAGSTAAPPDGLLVQGQTGIGTTSPGGMLHVKTNGSGYIIHENTLGGTNPYGMLFMAPGQTWYLLANSGTGPANSFGIFDGQAGQMRMLFMPSNGFVGVGTSAPSSLFHVNGQITMTDGSQGAGKILTSNTSGTGTWKTNQIAFFCGANPVNTTIAYSASQTATLVFNSGASPLNLNVGGAYTPATGMFTAPVAGVYQFDAVCVFAGATNGFCQLKLRHSSGNLIAEQEGFYNTIGQNWFSGKLGATVHLNAGEKVYVEYYAGSAGGATFYQDKSTFSGHLVYAD